MALKIVQLVLEEDENSGLGINGRRAIQGLQARVLELTQQRRNVGSLAVGMFKRGPTRTFKTQHQGMLHTAKVSPLVPLARLPNPVPLSIKIFSFCLTHPHLADSCAKAFCTSPLSTHRCSVPKPLTREPSLLRTSFEEVL